MAKVIYSDISDVRLHYVFGELASIEIPKQVRATAKPLAELMIIGLSMRR